MKRKGLWIYTGLVAAVVAYAAYDYLNSKKVEESKNRAALMVTLNKDQISKITLKKPNETVLLEKTVDGWSLVEPLRDRANSSLVEEFVDGIVTEKSVKEIATDSSLDFKNYGLDQPRGEITVADNAGQSETFTVGSIKNFQGESFVYLPQHKKLVVAANTWFAKANKTGNEFRDRRWMRSSNADSSYIRIERLRDQKLEIIEFEKKDFEKEGLAEWIIPRKMDHGKAWKIDQNKVRELLNKLNVTDAIEFIGEGQPTIAEMKKWRMDHPQLKIQVMDSSKKVKWEGQFATGEDKISRAKILDPSFILKVNASDLAPFMDFTEDSMRDRREAFNFDRLAVKKIRILYQGTAKEFDASSERGRYLLKQLAEFQVSRFDESSALKKMNLDEKDLIHSLELQDGSGKNLFQIQFSKNYSLEEKNGAETGRRSLYFIKTTLTDQIVSLLESDINTLKLEEDFPPTSQEKTKD